MIIESKISNLIETQFPAFDREENPLFVQFVVEYYKWMEQEGKVLYYNRNYLENLDVDTVQDSLLQYIKEKYLKNIQFDTSANIRQLIKHALDIYRSKGTALSVDLIFRLVFSEVVDIYYPKDDLFKTSDGVWFRAKYLQLTLNDKNEQLYHKKIYGLNSGATAFVDSIIRRSIKHRLVDVAYISAISGQFVDGEPIFIIDWSESDYSQFPIIQNSLTSLEVAASGTGINFDVGDLVNLYSDYGELGVGRIANTTTNEGQLSFTLENGGFGYSSNCNVYLSNNVLLVSNVSVTNSYARHYFELFDTITSNSVTGKFIGINKITLNYDVIDGAFYQGDQIVQYSGIENDTYPTAIGTINKVYINSNEKKSIDLIEVDGVFVNDRQFYCHNRTGTVTSIDLVVGVVNTSANFVSNVNFTAPSCNGHIDLVSYNGSGGSVTVSNNFLYSQNVAINSDLLTDYLSTQLTATTYGFPGMPSGNLTSGYLSNLFSYSNVIVGTIQTLVGHPGSDYEISPVITVIEPHIYEGQFFDHAIYFDGLSSMFIVGEQVIQNTTNSTGIVVQSNSSCVLITNTRINANNRFEVTSNSTNYLQGTISGATANITSLQTNYEKRPSGYNANVTADVLSGNGAVTKIDVLSSGFGYKNGETVYFNKNNESEIISNTGFAFVDISPLGTSSGYYQQKGGFLSDQKKLYDGYYYQEFSYEIQSTKTLDKYQKLLKQITHVAGTAMYGKLVHKSISNNNITSDNSEITIS